MVTVIRVTPAEAAALAATKSPTKNNGNNNENGEGKKRALPSPPSGGKENSKRQRADEFAVDLDGVPPQQPIPKSRGCIKEGTSRYKGVSKSRNNKWKAEIRIEGKSRYIGYYENEEVAAIDFARAVFKYQGQEALDKARARGRNISEHAINNLDLSDVPPQPPILKSTGRMKEGASRYTGISFNKASNKWQAHIRIEGKQRYLGSYENEEEAAIDYARAVFKCKGEQVLDKERKPESTGSGVVIDLSDVPPQPPILKSTGRMKEGASKYTGVSFSKTANKWQARIRLEGKVRLIGYYKDEEEAAIDYARAAFKCKGQDALDKMREQNSSRSAIDLSDVSPKPLILKSGGRIKEGASKYTGVSFNKAHNKWHASIRIEGKQQCIGYYKNEEEAAIDYARAAFKYKGQEAIDKAREQKKLPLPAIDLSGVLPQPLLLKSADQIKEGFSKYAGVYFNKSRNIWTSTIRIDGNLRHIGYYESEEEAAIDYARAAFKYQQQCHNL